MFRFVPVPKNLLDAIINLEITSFMKRFYSFANLLFILIITTACVSVTPTETDEPSLILATTTSTQDSGLLDVLVPIFEEENELIVQTVAVGTGAALKMAEEGNADVLLVHAPAAEEELMAAGFGKDRMLIMHNDFIVVGPPTDPAGIAGKGSVAESFALIAEAEAPFVSRGDDSGTNKKELSIWSRTSYEPNSTKPHWYLESGQGMGASLVIASEKEAYTLTDRATYLATQQNLTLDVLVEGDPILLNIYHVMTVSPERWPNTNYEGALDFANFIVRDDVQAIIAEFGVEQYGQPLFFADAGKTVADLGLE